MKYNVGDRVRIKSLDWYNENKDKDGIVELSTHLFTPGMSQFCGKVMTISDVFEDIDDNGVYYMEEIDYDWTDEMIEGLVEEEAKPKYEDEVNGEYYSTPKYLVRPSGYQFVDENGNVINATKIVLEKKRKEYPKTYEECCKILGLNSEIADSELLFYYPLKCGDYTTIRLPEMEKFEKFIQLYLCRNAYWKLYGEEMGLEKPWEPDWSDTSIKYCLERDFDVVNKNVSNHKGHTFAFPTAEMRDAFYENFKELIEFVKKLL